jgi:O-methyltransferase/aklanonic acid methyltransferase
VHEQGAVGGVFDRAAQQYGCVAPNLFGYFANLLVERVGIPSGADVLDVATGTGAVLRAVARQRRHGRLVGLDSSAAMLARARREVRDPTVQFLEMDAQRLDLPHASFDVVLCSFGLQSFESPKQALLGMKRVLRPRGRLGLVYPRGWHFLSDERWRWQIEVFRHYGADIGMTETEPAGIERLLEQSGFEQTLVKQTDYQLIFRNDDEWWTWSWSHGTRILFEAVPSSRLAALRGELQQGLRERCTNEEGSIEGTLKAFVVTARG